MTTITTDYAQPSAVMLGRLESGVLVNRGQTHTVRYGETLTLCPVWCSSYTGVQAQYRIRNRKNYASGLLDDDTGAEVWTDFPDWTEPSGATTNAGATIGGVVVRYASGLSFSYTYDISSYDMHEVEVRVRVYSASGDKASEWTYGTVNVVYCPILDSYTASTAADGSVLFTYSTNLTHRSPRINLVTGWDEDSTGRIVIWSNGVYANEGEVLRFGPASLVAKKTAIAGSVWVETAYMTSGDGATLLVAKGADNGCEELASSTYGGYVITPGAHVDPQDVPTPTISSSSATAKAVTLVISCQCDHIVARASYTDTDGRYYNDYLDIGGASPSWTATLPYPPYGTTITVKVAACNATGGYKLISQTFIVETSSHLTLDGDGDHVELMYDGELSISTELTGESVQTAGRKLPVSRHGVNISRTFQVKGTIAFPSVFTWGDMELAALQVMDNPHDWLYRDPKGARKTVRIVSWQADQSTDQMGRVAEVTVRMEEVG